MNKFCLLLLLGILCCSISSCEKDDLCIPEEADVPRLIILFTDINNPILRKPVASLQVIDAVSGKAAPLNLMGAMTLTEVDSIAIPLRVDAALTDYFFERTLNEVKNRDQVQFNYEVVEEYINRACGYKATYIDLTFVRPAENPANPWIRNVIVRNSNVTSNRDIHVEIRH